jgi:hypothetical protein
MTVSAIKAFNKGMFLRFARLDKFEVYALRLTLTHKNGRPKLAPVVHAEW